MRVTTLVFWVATCVPMARLAAQAPATQPPAPAENKAPGPNTTQTPAAPASQATTQTSTQTDTQDYLLSNTPTPPKKPEYLDAVHITAGALTNPDAARILLENTQKDDDFIKNFQRDPSRPAGTPEWNVVKFTRSDIFVLIHIVKWNDPPTTGAQTVQSQNWYVYNNGQTKQLGSRYWTHEDFASNNRLYGAKVLYVVYVHLNKRPVAAYQVSYAIETKKKLAQNVNDLFTVAQLSGEPVKGGRVENAPNVWGGGVFGIAHYNTSDITITPSIIPDGGTQSSLGKATTFDNEGLHWWDVSGAVPIRRVSQLQFNQSNSTVTQQSVDKTTVFALFDVYLPRRDLKGSGFSYLPSYVAGIGITKQPLHRLLVGVSWGPAFANFYIGAVFATQSLPTGTSCSKNQVVNQPMGASETRTCAQLSFGINIGALALQKALAKK